jgi:hypothetical protein
MFDTSFEVLNDERGYMSYRGRTRTLITYQPGERLWMMKLVNNPRVWAVTNVSMASMIMGDSILNTDDNLLRNSFVQEDTPGECSMTLTAATRRPPCCSP